MMKLIEVVAHAMIYHPGYVVSGVMMVVVFLHIAGSR